MVNFITISIGISIVKPVKNLHLANLFLIKKLSTPSTSSYFVIDEVSKEQGERELVKRLTQVKVIKIFFHSEVKNKTTGSEVALERS